MKKKILLVEGSSDKTLFEPLCEYQNLNVEVQISTPKDVGARKDGKSGIFKHLEILLKNILDGRVSNLGILIKIIKIV